MTSENGTVAAAPICANLAHSRSLVTEGATVFEPPALTTNRSAYCEMECQNKYFL
jgi:hypothetical protein